MELPRGAITELFGPASSGRTTFVCTFLASATKRGEFCTLIDASNAFDPASADRAGADLKRLLWVRCGHDAMQALRCADLLAHSGGWGVIVLDLGDIAPAVVRRIPISYWYRFRVAVEHTPAVFLVVETEPYVKTSATMAVEFRPGSGVWTGAHPDFRVLRGQRIAITPKKPARSMPVSFDARALA